MPRTLRTSVGRALPVQVAWAILAAIWNLAGAMLIARGLRALGPTATVAGGVTSLAIAAALVVFVTRWPIGYLGLSVLTGVIALTTAIGAFTQDPGLWPSEFWRYAGAVLNGIGFLAAAAGVLAYFKWRK